MKPSANSNRATLIAYTDNSMNLLYPLLFASLSVGCGASGGSFQMPPLAEEDRSFGPYCYNHASMQVAQQETAPNGFTPQDAIAAAQGMVVDFDLTPQ